LYGGQQFCRRCGAPVGEAAGAGGEAATRLFPQAAQPAQSPPAGAAQVRTETGPVGAQQPTAYYPSANMQQTSPLVGSPFGSQPLAVAPASPIGPPAPGAPVRGRRGGWLLVLLTVFVLGAVLASGATYLWWRASRRPADVGRRGVPGGVPHAPAVPVVPPVPEDLGDRIKEALKTAGVPLPIDESGATVTGTETVLTQTYELDADSAFGVRAANGDVTVTGTDGDHAVVKITKRGGSPGQREDTHVLASQSDEGLTLLTAPGQGAGVSVSYEVSLPRNLRRLEISAERGDIKVEGFDGAAVLNLTNGNITVASGGEVKSRLVNGKTSVAYAGPHEEAQEFSVVNGDVEVSFGGEQAADLKAAATNGRIEAAGDYAAKVEKRGGGQRLETELGEGGGPLTIKVVNGNIKLRQ
jgi:hypothetical protein